MKTRNRYRIIVESADRMIADIWASDLNDAWAIASELDGGDFHASASSWDIEEIVPGDELPNFNPVND